MTNIIQMLQKITRHFLDGFRDPLRQGASNEELLSIISNAVQNKKRRHAGNYSIAIINNV